ncbi:hypothetical protein J4G37_17965 [Microvirga sp. 3-52]|nr:hypothetical protein [Microvirga sp. 3-52]
MPYANGVSLTPAPLSAARRAVVMRLVPVQRVAPFEATAWNVPTVTSRP